ncbi:MAG: hypothetical protein OEO21_01355, partial [Candidatus Krumholzibacteria bacterium]|nr:hypothetical protein [Candidatus Krumholzibacteria bacterium]
MVDTLRDVETGRRLTLAHAFLVPASDIVVVAGATLTREAYRIDYHMGTLRIDTPVPPGSVAIVRYRRQPVMLSPVYSLRPVEISESPERAPPARATTFEERAEPTLRNLAFGGTKSVSFTVGSDRGSTLDQTLQATIEGNVTPTIKVRALLSDNNLPVQPEGNTETLEYFDQVFVEIEGTRARTTLGDFSFTNTLSSFSPVTRQLKGISASAWREGGARVSAAGATSKGVFRTAEFRGTTGLQGPYELLSASRNTLEVVIAGTERVFVDGVQMQRGQNQDYVMDYDRGSVTFTPRRLVTNDTEIAVDFEVT